METWQLSTRSTCLHTDSSTCHRTKCANSSFVLVCVDGRVVRKTLCRRGMHDVSMQPGLCHKRKDPWLHVHVMMFITFPSHVWHDRVVNFSDRSPIHKQWKLFARNCIHYWPWIATSSHVNPADIGLVHDVQDDPRWPNISVKGRKSGVIGRTRPYPNANIQIGNRQQVWPRRRIGAFASS